MSEMTMQDLGRMLSGSQNLNNMKAEINAVITMVMGMIHLHGHSFKMGKVLKEFQVGDMTWKITETKCDIALHAIVASKEQMGFSLNTYVYSSAWEAGSVRLEYIDLVHAALPRVVSELCELFPRIRGGITFLQGHATG